MNNTPCHCQQGCQSRRCACLKAGKACVDECHCLTCKNPFNTIKNTEQLTGCARWHIKKVVSLADKELDKKSELPCGCKKVSLRKLLEEYRCPRCGESYYYSFCMNDIVDTNGMWHCQDCGTCREDGEWHCEYCNLCTFGLTLSCENCGRKSPYMPG